MNAFVRVVAAAVAVLLLSSASAVHGQGLITILVASTPVDDATPVLYAIRSGMFKRAGLDVEYTPMASGGVVAAGVVGNSLQIGFQSLVGIISAHAHNVPLTIVAPGSAYVSSAPTALLLVRKDSPIHTAADLNGKTIASTTLKDLNTAATFAWSDQNGGDSQTLKTVEIPYSAMLGALDENRIDAATMLQPLLAQAMASGKVRALAQPYDAISKHFMVAAWFATTDYVNANPDAVARFASVMRQASIYANAHHAETAPIVAALSGVDLATVQGATRATFAETLDPREIQTLIDAVAKYKVIDKPFAAQEIVSPVLAGVYR